MASKLHEIENKLAKLDDALGLCWVFPSFRWLVQYARGLEIKNERLLKDLLEERKKNEK